MRSWSFTPLPTPPPCVLLRADHPLAEKERLGRPDLDPYPLASYDRGNSGTALFSEEGVLLLQSDRQITVNDGLMLAQVLTSTWACAVGLPLMAGELSKYNIITRPLEDVKPLRVGWIKRRARFCAPGKAISANAESGLSGGACEVRIHRLNLWIRMLFRYLHKKTGRAIVFL